jgi:hypothetical protein
MVVVVLLLSLVWAPMPTLAADLGVEEVHLAPCPASDPGSQAGGRSAVATCYALRGAVVNTTNHPVVDTDLFAIILDGSGEPVLPNRARVGSLGDVPPGRSPFAVRLAIPSGTPEPIRVGQVKARGFKSPVRTRAKEGDEALPLEQILMP